MLRVQLFGNLRIHDDGRRLECFQSNRAKELFCYLLLHRDHPHSRDTLAGLFWAAVPYLLRDQINWSARNAYRWRFLHGIALCYGVIILSFAFARY